MVTNTETHGLKEYSSHYGHKLRLEINSKSGSHEVVVKVVADRSLLYGRLLICSLLVLCIAVSLSFQIFQFLVNFATLTTAIVLFYTTLFTLKETKIEKFENIYGIQVTKIYSFGRRSSFNIPSQCIVINEVITMQRVMPVLSVLIRCDVGGVDEIVKVIPLMAEWFPREELLKIIFRTLNEKLR